MSSASASSSSSDGGESGEHTGFWMRGIEVPPGPRFRTQDHRPKRCSKTGYGWIYARMLDVCLPTLSIPQEHGAMNGNGKEIQSRSLNLNCTVQ